MPLRAFRYCLMLPALAWGAEAEQARTKKPTPFDPPSTVAAAQAPAETIEFAGISTVEQRTDLIFFDKTAKKHRWVPIGETVEGISALKYDPQREQATVKINGVQKTLALRKGSGPTNAPAGVAPMHTGFATPAPVPMPVAAGAVTPLPGPTGDPMMQPGTTPAQQPTATANATPGAPQPPMTEQAKQEQEARMLVSDLLEIGMAQRKAYEEAQRKAQSGEPANPAAAVPPPVQPQPPNTTQQPAPTRPPGGE